MNAFEVLRVIAALWVLFSHAFAFYGLPEPIVFSGHTNVAVDVFFSISGYLVIQSWARDPNLGRFLLRRGLRIFPGLIVAVFVTTFVVGGIATNLKLTDYFFSYQTWVYVISNIGLTVSVDELPGVFENNTYPRAFNGSLWTLRYELLMYFLLALLGGLGLVLRRPQVTKQFCLLLFLIFLLLGITLSLQGVTNQTAPFPLLWRLGFSFDIVRIANLGINFFLGCCLYLYREQIRLSFWFVLPVLLIALFLPSSIWQQLLIWFLVPYMTIVTAWNAPALLKKFRGFDYSYGIYIYAFPLQQLVAMYGAPRHWSFGLTLLCSLALTLIAASLSWHWIEHPALALKPVKPRADSLAAKQFVATNL